MEDFKKYLITRLVAVILIVAACEQFLTLLFSGLRTVFAFYFADMAAERVSPWSVLLVVWGLISGNTADIYAGGLSTVGAVFNFLYILIMMVPVVAGILIYARLIVKQVRILEEERDMERAAYESRRNLMLSDFAHDLRNPIMTIGGYARALSDGMVREKEQKQEYLQAIVKKSDRMTELINQLFEYVRLGSSGFELHRDKVELHGFLTEILAANYPDFENAGMELTAEIPEMDFMILADAGHLKRVIENLLVNILRHNPKGTRAVLIVRKVSGAEFVYLADNGTEIHKSGKELFDPFVKEDASRSGDKGSGLGLSVAKQVMDMHGFDLHLCQPWEGFTKAFELKFTENEKVTS